MSKTFSVVIDDVRSERIDVHLAKKRMSKRTWVEIQIDKIRPALDCTTSTGRKSK